MSKKALREEKSGSQEDNLKGYKGYARKKLEAAGAKIWNIIEIEKDKKPVRGIILPRSEFEKDTIHVNLKLKSGYNVGIELTDLTKITVHGCEAGEYRLPEKEIVYVLEGQIEFDDGRVVRVNEAICNLPNIPHSGKYTGIESLRILEIKSPCDHRLPIV